MRFSQALLSPEAEAGFRPGRTVEELADLTIRQCGGIDAAIDWCRTWRHRPGFRALLDELTERTRAT